jgi:hypothetical protein
LPEVPKVVLVEEALVRAEGKIGQAHSAGVVPLQEAVARDDVVCLADAEAVEVKVGPAEEDLEGPMEVGEGAIGPNQDAPPEQGMDVPDPGIDQVGVGRGGRIHGVAMLPDQSLDVAFALRLKCSPLFASSDHSDARIDSIVRAEVLSTSLLVIHGR